MVTHYNTLQHITIHCNTLILTIRVKPLVNISDSAFLGQTATHCITLHHTDIALHYIATLHNSATHCNTLQYTAAFCSTYCNPLHRSATLCNTLQHTAAHCNTLQYTATHCNTLQHAATRYSTPATWTEATSKVSSKGVPPGVRGMPWWKNREQAKCICTY